MSDRSDTSSSMVKICRFSTCTQRSEKDGFTDITRYKNNIIPEDMSSENIENLTVVRHLI
jgi:hypothetical protein